MPKQIAWGTIALAVGVLSGYLIVIPAAMQGFIPYWVASILCGYLAFASFTVGHDAGHGAIIRSGSRWKRLETFLGWLSTVPLLATSYKLFQKIHDRHHSFTNDPDRDPDYMPGDKGIVQLILGLGIIPFRYNWLAVTRFKKDKAMRDTYLPTLVFFSLVWGTLLALAIMGYATEVVFFSLVPLAIANFLLLTFFDYIPHYPHKSQDVYQATRIYPGKLLNVLLFGQNYHLIHHMYPKLPWYRYKAVYERLEPYLEQQDAAIDHIEQGEKLYSSSNGIELTDGATKLHWNARVKTVN
jgi:fatty acid desaturase